MYTLVPEDGELGTVEKGFIISIWVLAIDFAAGLLFAALGYEWAMSRAASFAGIYITAAGAVWVGYIIYTLLSGGVRSQETQSELSEWDDTQERKQ